MAQTNERYELRLRPEISPDKEMIAELDEVSGVYGMKNQLMSEWVIRGLSELEQRTQQASSATGGDEVSVLDAVAQAVAMGSSVNHRIVTAYLEAKEKARLSAQQRATKRARRAPLGGQEAQAAPVAPVAPQAPVAPMEAAERAPSVTLPPEVAAAPVESPEPPPGAPKAKVDWSHLRGVAGSRGKQQGN